MSHKLLICFFLLFSTCVKAQMQKIPSDSLNHYIKKVSYSGDTTAYTPNGIPYTWMKLHNTEKGLVIYKRRSLPIIFHFTDTNRIYNSDCCEFFTLSLDSSKVPSNSAFLVYGLGVRNEHDSVWVRFHFQQISIQQDIWILSKTFCYPGENNLLEDRYTVQEFCIPIRPNKAYHVLVEPNLRTPDPSFKLLPIDEENLHFYKE